MRRKRKQVVPKHELVPKHEKLAEKDRKELLEKYNITIKELPRILKDDPAIAHMSLKAGDVIKITRNSRTAGAAVFYRGVADV